MLGKAGGPASRVQHHRHNFQQDPWHNPPTHDTEARKEVRNTHLPYHAPKQEQASEQKHINKEMGNAHAIVTMLGGLLNDDPGRDSLL
jgi:hypothetical protein